MGMYAKYTPIRANFDLAPNLTPSDKKFSLTPNKVSCSLLTRNLFLVIRVLLSALFAERAVRVAYPLWSALGRFSPLSRTYRTKQKKREAEKPLLGTRNRGRTGTGITAHRILSPACLPIPPSEPHYLRKDGCKCTILFLFYQTISLLLSIYSLCRVCVRCIDYFLYPHTVDWYISCTPSAKKLCYYES